MVSPELQMMRDYLNVLFDPGELICPSDSAFDVEAFPVEDVIASEQTFEFVVVNPLFEGSTRADDNVSVFRNFLIEMDTLALPAQEFLVERELMVPFATKVYSGGKSYHYIISLAEPLSTLEEYRRIAQTLMDVLQVADKKCKNPSRFTRMAGAARADKGGALQRLHKVGKRITMDELQAFLFRFSDRILKQELARNEVLKKVQVVKPEDLEAMGGKGRLALRTKNYIKEGATRGSRNDDLFFAACDFKNNLFDIEEAKAELMAPALASGLSRWEINQAINSAYKTAGIRPRVV